MTTPEPLISVGIVRGRRVPLELPCAYRSPSGLELRGRVTVELRDGRPSVGDRDVTATTFEPVKADALFAIPDVEIGIGFHWDRRERQLFAGALRFCVEEGEVWVVNEVPVETYLTSVIASEMSAQAPAALLRAHAICSRSWLMAQINHKRDARARQTPPTPGPGATTRITWRDREDHTLFDVCADDHCQRYQGQTRVGTSAVRQAIADTRGQVITHNGQVCDARFSKCCGGLTELYSTCWGDTDIPYLRSVRDTYCPVSATPRHDPTTEDGARAWVESRPEAFCDTTDESLLQAALNSYDREERHDYYRWQVTTTAERLGALIERKTGLAVGSVTSLEALERGPSARIKRLRVVGQKATIELGKELEIRRALSDTHLLSSAFVADIEGGRVTLRGAGWGHGVGLCQIGAAVMANKGFGHQSILYHYFRGAHIEKLWL